MDPAGGGQPPGGGKPGDRRAPLPLPHGGPRAQPAPGQPAAPPPQAQPGYPPPAQPGYPPQAQPPAYAQPPYAQPPYAQPPYAQPPYAQPPYAQPYAQPRPGQPYPQPMPGQPYPYPQPPPGQPYPPPPYGPPHFAPPGPPPPRLAPTDHSFAEFLKISMRRAFRLRIEPAEVTPSERIQLSRDGVTDPVFQAFLAWRRSVLFAFATAIVPLMLLKAYELYSVEKSPVPIIAEIQSIQTGLGTIPLVAEVIFCVLAWMQLGRWTQWRKQRRVLAIGWLVFFLAPFIVHLYPLRSVADDSAGGPERLMIGILISVQAMMVLAPKAVSLIPGMVRAAIVTKLLFPGASAPGWLIVLGAPIYALFIYVVLIVPFQITGSGYFVVAILGIILAEFLLGRGGYRLARPLTRDDALAAVRRIRATYLVALLASGVFIVIALADLIEQLDFEALTVVNLIGTFLTNVWILTLITTDMLIASLDQARGLSAGTSELAADVNVQLGAFVGKPTRAIDAVADPTAEEPRP